jgi:hypothetical protein
MDKFIKLGDSILIIGDNKSEKKLFAQSIASHIKKQDKNVKIIYVDWCRTASFELEDIYSRNKNKKTIIIFDNYIEIKNKARFSHLFKYEKNFTMIFIMNYIYNPILKFADIIFFSKTTCNFNIDTICNKLSYILPNMNINKNSIVNNMSRLKSNGFLYLNKFNKNLNKEYLIK